MRELEQYILPEPKIERWELRPVTQDVNLDFEKPLDLTPLPEPRFEPTSPEPRHWDPLGVDTCRTLGDRIRLDPTGSKNKHWGGGW